MLTYVDKTVLVDKNPIKSQGQTRRNMYIINIVPQQTDVKRKSAMKLRKYPVQ